MRIIYVKDPEQKILLKDIAIGTIFRPVNTDDIYMKLDHNGGSDFLTNNCSYLWSAMNGDYEGEDFETRSEFEENHDYEDTILCVDMKNGNISLLYKYIEIDILNCELVVKE